MEQLTIRIREETKESIEGTADEYDVSVSEHVRELIRKGQEYDDIKQERDRLRDQISAINARRDDVTEIVEYVDQERSWRRAPLWKRAKWWLVGQSEA